MRVETSRRDNCKQLECLLIKLLSFTVSHTILTLLVVKCVTFTTLGSVRLTWPNLTLPRPMMDISATFYVRRSLLADISASVFLNFQTNDNIIYLLNKLKSFMRVYSLILFKHLILLNCIMQIKLSSIVKKKHRYF